MAAEKDLTFGGQERFDAPPERVYAVLTDLDLLAQSIPNLTSAERTGERTMNCVVRPGFSFLRGTLKLAIELVELEPPQAAKMRIAAAGIGVNMTVESSLAIAEEAGASRLDWEAKVTQLKGLVATVSPALVRGAADQIIRHAWSKVGEQLPK